MRTWMLSLATALLVSGGGAAALFVDGVREQATCLITDCDDGLALMVDAGSPPSWDEAQDLPQVQWFKVGDAGFESPHVNGDTIAFRGTGTLADPYVIEGIHVTGALEIRDTNACFVIRNSYFSGHVHDKLGEREWRPAQLRLNFAGDCVQVTGNHIADLRINQNIPRTGHATAGIVAYNEIAFAGQIRHFSGTFAYNEVGVEEPSEPPSVPSRLAMELKKAHGRVANLDGFNQGMFRDNAFYGGVDLDFHGHYHGWSFDGIGSHYHGADAHTFARESADHADRWTSASFIGNRIVGGYGLRYEDRNHAGDDRAAKSESAGVEYVPDKPPMPPKTMDASMDSKKPAKPHADHAHDSHVNPLDAPHTHQTDIRIEGNHIDGGRLLVDVFMAEGIRLWDDGNYGRVHYFHSQEQCRTWWGWAVDADVPVGDVLESVAEPCAGDDWKIVPHPELGRDLDQTVDSHAGGKGTLHLMGNDVRPDARERADKEPWFLAIDSGIQVMAARDAHIYVHDNNVVVPASTKPFHGIAFERSDDVRIEVANNEVSGPAACGVLAERVTGSWAVTSLDAKDAQWPICRLKAPAPNGAASHVLVP